MKATKVVKERLVRGEIWQDKWLSRSGIIGEQTEAGQPTAPTSRHWQIFRVFTLFPSLPVAVTDFEIEGLSAARGDLVVEVGMVLLDG